MDNTCKLGLGTVQFGMEYGVSNSEGVPRSETVADILGTAKKNGISVLDTAPSYGNSEQVLGDAIDDRDTFRIITKLPKIQGEVISDRDIESLKNAFDLSLTQLRTGHVDGLLVHNPDDLLKNGADKLYLLLDSLKSSGVAKNIGVSIAGINRPKTEEIDRLFSRYDFDLVQLPQNVLDQKLTRCGYIERLRKKEVEIHVRSVFLQGLLLMDVDDLHPYFSPAFPVLKAWHSFLKDVGLSQIEGAIGYVRDCVRPDVILTGVTSEEELLENIAAFNAKVPDDVDFSQFAISNRKLINPYFWDTGR